MTLLLGQLNEQLALDLDLRLDQLLLKRLVLLKDGGNGIYCFWLFRSRVRQAHDGGLSSRAPLLNSRACLRTLSVLTLPALSLTVECTNAPSPSE